MVPAALGESARAPLAQPDAVPPAGPLTTSTGSRGRRHGPAARAKRSRSEGDPAHGSAPRVPGKVYAPMAIRKLLVANRGEIALRVFRACRELGIGTVAVAAPDDARLAARALGRRDGRDRLATSTPPSTCARRAKPGADAVHPGYGFLAENADFAEAVEAAGLTWVGPPPDAIRAGGDKLAAKRVAPRGGRAGRPAGHGGRARLPAARQGRGGRRRARHARRARGRTSSTRRSRPRGARRRRPSATTRSSSSATSSGRGTSRSSCSRTRTATVVALGERECSVQRRHQKVLEEAPSPALDPALRARMSEAAVAFARAIGYRSAGTAEFVLDAAATSSSSS